MDLTSHRYAKIPPRVGRDDVWLVYDRATHNRIPQ
jgi:hypothetical protein